MLVINQIAFDYYRFAASKTIWFFLQGILPLSIFFSNQLLAQVKIESPDKRINFILRTDNGRLHYSAQFNGKTVVEPSVLGLVVNGAVPGENSAIGKITRSKLYETYSYRGVHSTAINSYNGAVINMNSSMPFAIEIRVFNDGVAFRYLVGQKDSLQIEKESTEFGLPAGTLVWSQPNIRHYEGRYSIQLVDTIPPDGIMGPPATFVLPNGIGYAAITEGGLVDFGGFSLISKGERKFGANLTGKTKKSGTIDTPWRIIAIGKDLNTLVNCDIIANVSQSYDKKIFPKGYDTEWIKPGRSVWSWLAVRRSVTLENMKRFTDLAADLGFEYNLVDEGWGYWKDTINGRDHWDLMKELVDYSAQKGIKIWAWKAYPDRGGIPGIEDSTKRQAFFKKAKAVGIVGLKIDFFDSEAQGIIRFYQHALRDAAECQLMLNFHGANKPTGETRTWPNEMTREAVRGLESRPPWAFSNTVIPFTRYLAGHADYTPVHFGNRMGEVSWAHHVASMAVFTSPFLCIGADPQSILDNPSREMIQSIPPTWDETIVLPQSNIGELVLYARRKGDTWFLAAMNGLNEAKSLTVNLSFLKKGSFNLSAMKDEKEKQASAVFENTIADANTKLTIELRPNGGYVGRFTKTK